MLRLEHLRVSVTTDCNVRCWYCFNEGQKKEKLDMSSVDDFRWFISKMLNRYDIGIVRFTGGEPLLNPQLTTFINIAKEHGAKSIGLTTNGDLLPRYCTELNQISPLQCTVSLHQINTKKDCDIEYLEKCVSNAVEMMGKVKINVVVTQTNIDLVRQIVGYCLRNNISMFLIELNQSNSDCSKFSANFINHKDIIQILNQDFGIELMLRDNVFYIYENETMSIKVSDSAILYRTPIVISPMFSVSAYGHLGQRNFSIVDAINNKDAKSLFDVMDCAINYSCSSCEPICNRTPVGISLGNF